MTDPDPPPVLNYVPQVYRHRQTKTAGWATFTLLAAVVVGIMDWRHQGAPFWAQALIVATPALLTACTYLWGRASECRVEGDQLWFSAGNVPPTSVAIADLIGIDQIDAGDGFHYEVTVRDKGRMKVGADVFRPIDPLRRALLATNPGLRFGRRSGNECGWCGAAPLSAADRGHCPSCKKPFPRVGQFVRHDAAGQP